MSEGTYEYECMRAELLGLAKPDYNEFIKHQLEHEAKHVKDEEADVEIMKDIQTEEEGMKKISGGIDELNSILHRTQSKINKLKVSCGSITNIIKGKVGGRWNSQASIDAEYMDDKPVTEAKEAIENMTETSSEPDETTSSDDAEIAALARKSDLAKALDTDLSRLDAMIEKAENAHYSMSHQSKQMRRFMQ